MPKWLVDEPDKIDREVAAKHGGLRLVQIVPENEPEETDNHAYFRGPNCEEHARRFVHRHNLHDELVAACRAAEKAASQEWLYQTGQFCRPTQNYPPQGTVHGDLFDAATLCRSVVKKAEEQRT